MNLHISDLVVVCTLLLLAGIVATIFVALLGIKASIRRRRGWKACLGIVIAITVLQIPLLLSHQSIEDASSSVKTWYYTFHPTRPTTIDGIAFPAGTTVIEYPNQPHVVLGGTAPAGASLLGLKIAGDFTILHRHDDAETPVLSGGTLVEPADIHGVSCAAGAFTHEPDTSSLNDTVSCTLVSPYDTGKILLPAGTHVSVTFDADKPRPEEISGEASHAWTVSNVKCAAGSFSYAGNFSCPLDGDQVFDGYPISSRHASSLFLDTKELATVREGMLSSDFEVDGVHMPAGTQLTASYDGQYISAKDLRAGNMDDDQFVKFELPDAARLTIAGAQLGGGYIGLYFYNHSIKAHTVDVNDDREDGVHDGRFDLATRTWCWDKACGE